MLDLLKAEEGEEYMGSCWARVFDHGHDIGDVYDTSNPDYKEIVNNAMGLITEAFSELYLSNTSSGFWFDYLSIQSRIGFGFYKNVLTFIDCFHGDLDEKYHCDVPTPSPTQRPEPIEETIPNLPHNPPTTTTTTVSELSCRFLPRLDP